MGEIIEKVQDLKLPRYSGFSGFTTISKEELQYAIYCPGLSNDVSSTTARVFKCNDDGVFNDIDLELPVPRVSSVSATTVTSPLDKEYAIFAGSNVNRFLDIFEINDNTNKVVRNNLLSDTLLLSGIKDSIGVTSLKSTNGTGYALFAGGTFQFNTFVNDVDIFKCNDDGVFYDKKLELNKPLWNLKGVTIKNNSDNKEYALFSGGGNDGLSELNSATNNVFVYTCNDTGVFFSKELQLSRPRFGLTACKISNNNGDEFAMFAGGGSIADVISTGNEFNDIDIFKCNDDGVFYDKKLELTFKRVSLASTNIGTNNVIIGGGNVSDIVPSNDVDVFTCNDNGVYYNYTLNNAIVLTSQQLLLGGRSGIESTSLSSTNKSYALFAGGDIDQIYSNNVDIFSLDTQPIPCFTSGTIVLTDQGLITIEKIKAGKHTIRNKTIVNTTGIISQNADGTDYLVRFEENALGEGSPNKETVCSPLHKIYYNGTNIPAGKLLDQCLPGIHRQEYKGEKLYNIQLEKHSHMYVNGMRAETLHPRNIWAKKEVRY